MDIRYFNSEGMPIPAPDPDSYDEGSGTLLPNIGPGVIGTWYYDKDGNTHWYDERPLFATLGEAEAYLMELSESLANEDNS